MANFITVEMGFIDTIMGNMISSPTSTAGFRLAIMIETELELPKTKITWNTSLELNPIVPESIGNIWITLQLASMGRIHRTVGLQTLFSSGIRHLIRSIINCKKGKFTSNWMSQIALPVTLVTHKEGRIIKELATIFFRCKGDLSFPSWLTLKTSHSIGRDPISMKTIKNMLGRKLRTSSKKGGAWMIRRHIQQMKVFLLKLG